MKKSKYLTPTSVKIIEFLLEKGWFHDPQDTIETALAESLKSIGYDYYEVTGETRPPVKSFEQIALEHEEKWANVPKSEESGLNYNQPILLAPEEGFSYSDGAV